MIFLEKKDLNLHQISEKNDNSGLEVNNNNNNRNSPKTGGSINQGL